MLTCIARGNGESSFVDGIKVELSSFMANRVGVCRHQALACAVLLEKFKDDGHVRGIVSVDRNVCWNPTGALRDGHAWVRYTAHSGKAMILDVAQNYFGLLESSSQDHAWNYLRPKELQAAQAPLTGAVILAPGRLEAA